MILPRGVNSAKSGVTLVAMFCCLFTCLLTLTPSVVYGSHRSIQIDSNGHYRGVAMAFSNDFTVDASNQVTIVKAIMEQMQKASDILKQLIGVQFGEVIVIIPEEWSVMDQLLNSGFSVQEHTKYTAQTEADIIFTDDDKEQILTMQYGECGEGALPINFPKKYISDLYTPKLLAHQWILYRYGVFNEFGYVNDFNYPVYFLPPDGNVQNSTQRKPKITSCSSKKGFSYSSQCDSDLSIDPNTGRPVNLNCDVVPLDNLSQSSFMYAPLSVSELKLCNSTTHDYLSPNKQNVLCDYQSTQDVINNHTDFDIFKPNPSQGAKSSSIHFKIWQNRKMAKKVNVMYALPSQDSKLLEVSMKTIEQLSAQSYNFFYHQAKFSLYNEAKFDSIQDWHPSSDIPMVFPENKPITKPVNVSSLVTEIIAQFSQSSESAAGGVCVLFFSGKMSIENAKDESLVERLEEQLNEANIALKVIIFDKIPSNDVLHFFDQLSSKLSTRSSVNYAFADSALTESATAFRNQIVSVMNTVLLDMLQEVTDQTHIVLKRETVRSNDKAGVNFTIDSTIADNSVLIEMHTNGNAAELAMHPKLTIANNLIDFKSLKMLSDNSVIILYSQIKPGGYKFDFESSDDNSFITITVRVLAAKSNQRSYKDGLLSGRCWIQPIAGSHVSHPYRGYVQINQGLNGLVYDADVSFIVRPFAQSQQNSEITFPLYDNGRGSPDISARDGIYSGYLDPMFFKSESGNVAYTIFARVVSEKMSVKPGNFGNTVLFKNKSRCCGNNLDIRIDDIIGRSFERIINCGSFYYSMEKQSQRVRNKYSIGDLRLVNIDPTNRTLNLEWSTPFITLDQNNPPIIKVFHSYSENSQIALKIKENFDQLNEVEIEIVNETNEEEMVQYDHNLYELAPEAQVYTQAKFELRPNIANSQRQVKIRIQSQEEGFYFVAVKERNRENESKPSNVVLVYLQSNVPIENTTALAIDDSKLPEGTFRESLRHGNISWIHILIICICSALVLFLVILVIICVTIKKHRKASKASHVDYKERLNGVKKPSPMLETEKTDTKNSYYLTQDASSLMSHSIHEKNQVPISNASNNTSCSSVNTVDNPNPNGTFAVPGANFDAIPCRMANDMNLDNGNNNSILKELNVATLLPNSWDAKELLDHWGRVQEAKQRQESPPMVRVQSHSPSIPSYEGSSLDNYNQQSYLCQPATVQPMNGAHYMAAPHHQHQYLGTVPAMGHAEYQHQPSQFYSPYSNASSIWQHQHQQQPHPTHQHPPAQPYHHVSHFDSTYTSPSASFDDNGLPEYSVVRKIHPNISQV